LSSRRTLGSLVPGSAGDARRSLLAFAARLSRLAGRSDAARRTHQTRGSGGSFRPTLAFRPTFAISSSGTPQSRRSLVARKSRKSTFAGSAHRTGLPEGPDPTLGPGLTLHTLGPGSTGLTRGSGQTRTSRVSGGSLDADGSPPAWHPGVTAGAGHAVLARSSGGPHHADLPPQAGLTSHALGPGQSSQPLSAHGAGLALGAGVALKSLLARKAALSLGPKSPHRSDGSREALKTLRALLTPLSHHPVSTWFSRRTWWSRVSLLSRFPGRSTRSYESLRSLFSFTSRRTLGSH